MVILPACFYFCRVAVVTGSNKGIGFGISKLLASKGVLVVLTARDEKKGNEALEKLKDYGLSDNVIFHQLDVADSASISSLADFINTKFGKLDILVCLGKFLFTDSLQRLLPFICYSSCKLIVLHVM
jgi:NAD(P)-dependent dehydrogenase (short-subunit alcohol dehydrogenase family)